MRSVELVIDGCFALGEGPRWHVGRQALYFVDITAHRLHRFDPATGDLRTRAFDVPVACFAFRPNGGFLLGAQEGYALIDDFDAPFRPFGVQTEAARPWSRLNDGRCDPQGRFWGGTMDGEKTHHDARVLRLDPDGTVADFPQGGLTLNGVAFSPDGRRMMLSDTPSHLIRAYDRDPATGDVSNLHDVHQFPMGHGRPDGGSFDADGFYWVALYAGARVVRVSPKGEVVEEVAIPAKNVSMVSFGGPDLRTAYVTTARQGMTDEELAQYPHAGGVFAFRVETPGLPEVDFAG